MTGFDGSKREKPVTDRRSTLSPVQSACEICGVGVVEDNENSPIREVRGDTNLICLSIVARQSEAEAILEKTIAPARGLKFNTRYLRGGSDANRWLPSSSG